MNPDHQQQRQGRRILPSRQALEYLKLALELLLLLLAVPYLIRELSRHPGQVSKRAAAKHLS